MAGRYNMHFYEVEIPDAAFEPRRKLLRTQEGVTLGEILVTFLNSNMKSAEVFCDDGKWKDKRSMAKTIVSRIRNLDLQSQLFVTMHEGKIYIGKKEFYRDKLAI